MFICINYKPINIVLYLFLCSCLWKQIGEEKNYKNAYILPFIMATVTMTSIFFTLSFNSLYMVSYSSLNIFIVAYLKSLSTKSKIWSPSGTFLISCFFRQGMWTDIPVSSHALYFCCCCCVVTNRLVCNNSGNRAFYLPLS